MVARTRRRLSAEETRERLLDAGVEALARNGMSIGMDAVSLEAAVREADVSRSSAYAAWSSGDEYSPQSLFQRAVLKRAVGERKATIERTHASILDIVESLGATTTPAQLLREMCRVAGGINARVVAESRSWQLVVGLRSVLNSVPADRRDDELADWVSDSEDAYRIETIDTIYRPLATLLGLRPRPEYGDRAYHYGEIAAAALAEGLAPRYFMRSVEYLDGIQRLEPRGGSQPWSLFSIGFESIVMTFFEPVDPEHWEHGAIDLG